jgi:hypothetical protein
MWELASEGDMFAFVPTIALRGASLTKSAGAEDCRKMVKTLSSLEMVPWGFLKCDHWWDVLLWDYWLLEEPFHAYKKPGSVEAFYMLELHRRSVSHQANRGPPPPVRDHAILFFVRCERVADHAIV